MCKVIIDSLLVSGVAAIAAAVAYRRNHQWD